MHKQYIREYYLSVAMTFTTKIIFRAMLMSSSLIIGGCGLFDPCNNCREDADFFYTCQDEFENDYNIALDCLDNYESDWFDEYGKIKYDDPQVWEEYVINIVPCSSEDVIYQSCLKYNQKSRSAAARAGNGGERANECIENENEEANKAKKELDCRNWALAVGLITE